MDSRELAELLKTKKEAALSLIYDRYAPALNGIIVRVVRSEEVAEAILQQTFLQAALTIDSFDPEKFRLFTWLTHIARDKAQEAVKTQIDHSLSIDHNQQLASLETKGYSTGMDKSHKDVLNMIYMLGYTPEETATRLNVSLDHVKVCLRAAIAQLGKKLQRDNTLLAGSLLLFIINLIA